MVCHVSLSFFVYEMQGREFSVSMSDHTKQHCNNFLPKRSHSPEKRQNWILWFTRVGEPAHISKISYLIGVEAAWHTVLICCTMSGTEQTKEQPQIGDRGSNSVAINQFLIFFFSIGSSCSRSLFSFANILYFTWLTSFDLINLKFFPCLMLYLFTENEAQII